MSTITTDADKPQAGVAEPGQPEAKPKKSTKGAKPAKKAKATKLAKATKKAKPAKKAAIKPAAERTKVISREGSASSARSSGSEGICVETPHSRIRGPES